MSMKGLYYLHDIAPAPKGATLLIFISREIKFPFKRKGLHSCAFIPTYLFVFIFVKTNIFVKTI
jgi:hypothetical protein